jgi:K+/H+ antiporter YhaU regulatory subunit KhtT
MVQADGAMIFNPSATTQIRAGGSIIAVGKSNNLVKLEKILNP